MEVKILGQSFLAETIKNCLIKVGFTLSDNAEFVVIAEDTPFDENYKVDTSGIEEMIKGEKDSKGLIIIMSQLPVGSCKRLSELLGRVLVYNPENLRVVDGENTYMNADRQIIGCSEEARDKMKKFYSWFKNPLLFMSLESAEMVKHSINCYLATSINFMNQISDYMKVHGGDIEDVIKGMRSDSRIGEKAYITPGKASRHLCRELKTLEELSLIKEVYKINQSR